MLGVGDLLLDGVEFFCNTPLSTCVLAVTCCVLLLAAWLMSGVASNITNSA